MTGQECRHPQAVHRRWDTGSGWEPRPRELCLPPSGSPQARLRPEAAWGSVGPRP